jgi:hypothetical protein
MAFAADYAVLSDRLDEELRLAPEPARGLFAKIIGSACARIPVLNKSGRVSRIDRLIESGAWTDAALALIELELPAWRLRRLVCDSGEWLCSLSRQPNLPIELDDTVDARHEVLPLAILRAFIDARRKTDITSDRGSAVPQLGQQQNVSFAVTISHRRHRLFSVCLRSYAAFMRMRLVPSRIHMRSRAH